MPLTTVLRLPVSLRRMVEEGQFLILFLLIVPSPKPWSRPALVAAAPQDETRVAVPGRVSQVSPALLDTVGLLLK